MKVYRDLIIRGSTAAMRPFVAQLDANLTGGWARDLVRERESRLGPLGEMHCFSCAADEHRPACHLWLSTRPDGNWEVSNVVPVDRPSLTYDEYNRIIEEFHDRFIKPAAQSTGVTVELGPESLQIEHFLSPATVRLLKSFSSMANRAVRHPLDERRWNEFLTAAHRERSNLDAWTLRRWLTEEENWPADAAHRLAIEYEQGRGLLAVYESQPA